MDVTALIKKANILIEALPYIQKFSNKTFVIKYGGNAMVNEEIKASVMEDITLLKFIGINPIIVHGGGPDITKTLTEMQMESRFLNGLRVTDGETMRVVQMVLMGKTNKEIVSLLNCNGGKALGLCGIDGGLIHCPKHMPEIDGKPANLGFVGEITKVNSHILQHMLQDEFIPVVAPIGMDEQGQSYNINADTVASAVACAVKAEKLITLTDVSGVKDADGQIIYEIFQDEILNMINAGVITGGMIPKLLGCLEAIDGGVNSVHIIDGRLPHCILLEIFTHSGIGTMIKKSLTVSA